MRTLGMRERSATRGEDLAQFTNAIAASGDFFEGDAPIVVARAPGRLDVMGGIADYSGSLVLELPLAAATFAAAQTCDAPDITIRSLSIDGEVSLSLEAIAPRGAAVDYATARALLADDPRRHWAAYVAGTLIVLGRERGLTIRRGLRVLIDSTVPAGKGVASSAALEVAAMQAVGSAYGMALEDRDLALLCQMVENLVVGAPCGVMDQMTAACGESNRLLALLCQPAEIVAQVAVPDALELWGIDSGIRHEVGGADYGSVRVGAFMGYRIIADVAGLPFADLGDGVVEIDDYHWHGYLANVPPAEWERTYRDRVPATLDGASFLARYGGITDRVTRVDPSRTYAVRQPTEHPIMEHHRVQAFRRILESGAHDTSVLTQLGALMYESHASYSACGLGSSGTDRLVELVRAAGPASGLYGAKITGGGSGGVVAVLARAGSRASVDAIASRYHEETGRAAAVLGGSSAGAVAFGVVRV